MAQILPFWEEACAHPVERIGWYDDDDDDFDNKAQSHEDREKRLST